MYLLMVGLSLFILLAISEYLAHFSSTVRSILVILYGIVISGLLLRFIVFPLLSLLRIYKHITVDEAAIIIGKHFPEIDDKLSNVLQLHRLEELSHAQVELIEAGIDQKLSRLEPIPLLSAINFKSNLKYLKYLLIPIAIILITWILQPSFIQEPTSRLIRFQEEFEKEMPFEIIILNQKLEAFQKGDFKLELEIQGSQWPDKLFLNSNGNRYLLQKIKDNEFSYQYKNLLTDQDFYFTDGTGFNSKHFLLKVFPLASINQLEVSIVPPAYTGLEKRIEKNISDLSIPLGSMVSYSLQLSNSTGLWFGNDSSSIYHSIKNNQFVLPDTILASEKFKVVISSPFKSRSDSLSWFVNMINDRYPVIQVESTPDTANPSLFYFTGIIDDDYGFSNLSLIIETGDSAIVQTIDIHRNTKPQRFYHYLDTREINMKKGSDISYYFKIADNDGINGPKSTTSEKVVFHYDSDSEIQESIDKDSESLKAELDDNLKQWKELQEEIKKFRKDLVNKELMSWDDHKKMDELMKMQQELQNKIENLNQTHEKINEKSSQTEQSERILKKQDQLERLFEQTLDPETLQKMQELQKMLEEMNKENAQEMLEQLEMSSKEFEEQLDRNLELFKQLEFEMKLEKNIEQMHKLAEEQRDLAIETEKASKEKSDELKERQDTLNQRFEELKKDLDKIDSLNKELEEPNKFDKKTEEQQKIDSLQQESSENLKEKKPIKASESQKKAADEMEEMAEEMEQTMEEDGAEQMGEDIENLRDILDKLIRLSVIQENLIDSVLPLDAVDPRYNSFVRNQFAMEQKLQSVRDSLNSLAKRQPAVQPFVLKEFNTIDYRLKAATSYLVEHRTADAAREQQYVMTSLNQLALMLNEAMEQMQKMMNSMMKGSSGSKSSCPKPGSGKPSSKSMKQMQEQLNEQMKALQKQMKEGKSKSKDGNKSGGMSEKFARMAAEQAKLRRMVEEYQKSLLDETGEKPVGFDGLMQDMEKTESDLVNKILNEETLKRQQSIMTRLLKSEKAEQEREKKEERKSDEGKNIKRGNPKEFLKYKENKEKDINLMRTIPLDFNPYYKEKVDKYFFKFDNIEDDVKK